jgi:hypothetical protein
MFEFTYYKVFTDFGGSLDNIAVDKRYDTIEERCHRAWCKLLENDRSFHAKMVKKIIAQNGVEFTKKRFSSGLRFEKVK